MLGPLAVLVRKLLRKRESDAEAEPSEESRVLGGCARTTRLNLWRHQLLSCLSCAPPRRLSAPFPKSVSIEQITVSTLHIQRDLIGVRVSRAKKMYLAHLIYGPPTSHWHRFLPWNEGERYVGVVTERNGQTGREVNVFNAS